MKTEIALNQQNDCSYCGITFDNAEALAEHKELHLSRPDFQCIQCERVFSTRSKLKLHMRAHVRPDIINLKKFEGSRYVPISLYIFL